MSKIDKCLKETTEYSAEDAKFMEMAINLSILVEIAQNGLPIEVQMLIKSTQKFSYPEGLTY